MDPNSNLAEQLRLASRFIEAFDNDRAFPAINEHDVNRLAELVLALDEWIRRGGFLPNAWSSK